MSDLNHEGIVGLNKNDELSYKKLLEQSQALKSGLGAVSWAVLEMFRRGGMEAAKINAIQEDMIKFFAVPDGDECNVILKVVEQRLQEDKISSNDCWY
ncbi:MAG: hypothetical protein KBD78_06865 [Oligoflexales bacterium]|nr:hypothetical protein [Oligoflexales bacterium]